MFHFFFPFLVFSVEQNFCFSENETFCPDSSILLNQENFDLWKNYFGNTLNFYIFADLINNSQKIVIDLNIANENKTIINIFGNGYKVFFSNNNPTVSTCSQLTLTNCTADFTSSSLEIEYFYAYGTKFTINSSEDVKLNIKSDNIIWFSKFSFIMT